jgi:hypothetical protein
MATKKAQYLEGTDAKGRVSAKNIREGISEGTFAANSGTAVTVADTSVTAGSDIVITLKTVGGTISAHPYLTTITAGTGFTVNSGASDTSTYNYRIIG